MLHHWGRKSFSPEGKIMPIRCCHIKPCGRKSIWPALAQSWLLCAGKCRKHRKRCKIGCDRTFRFELFTPCSRLRPEGGGNGKRWINVQGKVLSEKLKHHCSRKCFRLNRKRSEKKRVKSSRTGWFPLSDRTEWNAGISHVTSSLTAIMVSRWWQAGRGKHVFTAIKLSVQ